MGSGARIIHPAACPEISPTDCETENIPMHWHDQTIALGRLRVSWELGLGKGFQIGASLPVDLKVSTIQYTDTNDEPYTPPYAGIHHRNEVLTGLGDGQLLMRYVRRINDIAIFSGGLGVSLPFGRTEEDPYTLASQSLPHQHFQFGTGLFMPSATLSLMLRKDRFGLQIWGLAQLPPYTNGKGFRPGTTGTWGFSPQIKIHPRVDLLLPLEGVHQGRERWNGTYAASSGKHSLRTGLMIGITLKRGLWLYTQGTVPIWQKSLSTNTDDQILEPFVGTLGLSWSSDKAIWD